MVPCFSGYALYVLRDGYRCKGYKRINYFSFDNVMQIIRWKLCQVIWRTRLPVNHCPFTMADSWITNHEAAATRRQARSASRPRPVHHLTLWCCHHRVAVCSGDKTTMMIGVLGRVDCKVHFAPIKRQRRQPPDRMFLENRVRSITLCFIRFVLENVYILVWCHPFPVGISSHFKR